MCIWLATGNIHKKRELAAILPSGGKAWEIKSPAEAGIEFDPEETGSSFFENALIKAAELYRMLNDAGQPVWQHGDVIISDDSGLCVDALGGRPGIHSARYSGPEENTGGAKNGKNLDSAEKNALLLSELGDNPRRSARFVCAIVLYCGPDRFFAAQETIEGRLVENAEAARGSGGFGYDPILFIPELGLTVAELSEKEKNRYSHRGKAGRTIAGILNNF